MRRLALLAGTVAVALVLTASPAAADHSSDPIITGDGHTVHWAQSTEGGTVLRNGRVKASLERVIHVIVPSTYMADTQFAAAMRHAVAQGDRSPYINMVLDTPAVAPTSCPITHCITVYRAPMNGAVTSFGWDQAGHMKGRAAVVGFDVSPGEWLFNAACHEIAGHGLGLAHSSHGVQGPCVVNLTDHDLSLINSAHAHKDGGHVYGSVTGRTTSGRVWHTHSHSRAFYAHLGH